MKLTITAGAVIFLILIMTPHIAYASLNVNVSVKYSQILPIQNQIITATSNERGKGILLVIQPTEGIPWINYLDAHPKLKILWNLLPPDIKTKINNQIGGKIVSFNIINFALGGGKQAVTFPDDFAGINGAPSTDLSGEYKVIFAFLSYEVDASNIGTRCCLFEIGFDCIAWNVHVVPEVPIGTIAPLLTMIFALPAYRLFKKSHN